MTKWNASGKRLVLLWMRQIALNRMAHNNEAVKQSALNDRLNIWLVIFTGGAALSAVSGILANLLSEDQKWVASLLQGLVILASVLATVFAALIQTLKPAEKAEKNRQTAVQYNNLSNVMQKETVIDNPKPLHEFLEEVIDRFSYIQNYGSEVMKDQASTADLPNLVLIKDAARRRRTEARAAGKELSDSSSGGRDANLDIIGNNDHALFDAVAYQSVDLGLRSERIHSAPEARLTSALQHFEVENSSSSPSVEEDSYENSEELEDVIMNAACVYDDHTLSPRQTTIYIGPHISESESDEPGIMHRTQEYLGIKDDSESISAPVSASPSSQPVSPKSKKRRSIKKTQLSRLQTQQSQLDRLDAEQQKKMSYLQTEEY